MTNQEAREELLAMRSLLPEGMISSREALTCGANALRILAAPSPPDARDMAIRIAVEALDYWIGYTGDDLDVDFEPMCREALRALKAVQR